MHTTALSSHGQIWVFISWGTPFRLIAPELDGSSPDATPVQVECGWMYSAALTVSGDAYVSWPFGETMKQQFTARMREMNEESNSKIEATAENVIPAVTWDLHHNPSRLPPLPDLPVLKHSERSSESEGRPATKLVRIAGMDNLLIGLTNKGHVLKFGGLENETSLQQGRWEYVSLSDGLASCINSLLR